MAADVVTLRTAVEERDIELTVRAAEEREVIDLIRERTRRALTYIEGGRRIPAWQEVAAIGEVADRRARQLAVIPDIVA